MCHGRRGKATMWALLPFSPHSHIPSPTYPRVMLCCSAPRLPFSTPRSHPLFPLPLVVRLSPQVSWLPHAKMFRTTILPVTTLSLGSLLQDPSGSIDVLLVSQVLNSVSAICGKSLCVQHNYSRDSVSSTETTNSDFLVFVVHITALTVWLMLWNMFVTCLNKEFTKRS